MNFEPSSEQLAMQDLFAKFLNRNSIMDRVRVAQHDGIDTEIWSGLAALGAFGMRVPDVAGGLNLGLLDATLLMEQVGRVLAPGPIAEALVATRLLGQIGSERDLLARAVDGSAIVTIALDDVASMPLQWVPGGKVADAVVARDGDEIVLLSGLARPAQEPTLGSTSLAQLDLRTATRHRLSSVRSDLDTFAAAIEEWKLLIAAALSGLSREALRLAADYAGERRQFGVPIGTFQAISHPMADLLCEIDAGKFLVWKAIRDIAEGATNAAATVSLALWWNCETASRTVSHAVQTFGGYGLTTEYDIHLYNLHAKAWPLALGDPARLLEEAGARLYTDERPPLPDVGAVSIDFDVGDDARAIASEIDAFFAANGKPVTTARASYCWDAFDPEIHRKLADAKLLFLGWPEEMGGRGLGPYEQSAAQEAFYRHHWQNPAKNVAQMVATIIHRFGSDTLRRDVLPRIVSGTALCSLGFSEPGSGSDVFAAQCKATLTDAGWRIDGTKMFTSGANFTDYVLMLTRTNAEVAKHKGLTMFLVPLKAPGVTVQKVSTFVDERTNITFYDGVEISDDFRLGPVDEGVRTMSASLELEHGGGSGKSQRSMLRAAEAACSEIVRGGERLIDQPAARARLARTAANVMASLLLTDRSNWAAANSRNNPAFGPMAKMFSSERVLTDAKDLLELTAPNSLSERGHYAVLNQSYRHAHGTRIYGGTSQVHRSLIAERGLGLPRTRG